MGASSGSKIKNNENINFSTITQIAKIPNDQYTCIICKSVPEIIEINFDQNIIKFNCEFHGNIKIGIYEYFKNESNYLYLNYNCQFGQRKQIDHLDKTFYYCPKCDQYLCQSCNGYHNHKFSVIEVNELNCKCQKHLLNYFKFCKYCKKHYCQKDDKSKCMHPLEFINSPSEIEIEKLKKKRDQYFYLYKLLDTIITTYEKHPSNYFHSKNIINISQKLEENRNVELLEKINMFEKKIINILNDKYTINLSGEERILNLNNKNIGNKDFDLLCLVQFKNLEEINIEKNNISDISPLRHINPKVKKLNLSFNKINNINVFEDISKKNKDLEVILLNNNEIENADVFKKKIFKKIKEINLENNRLVKSDLDEIKRIIGDSINKNNKFKLVYKLNKSNNKIKLFGKEFIENNKNNFKISINGEEKDLCEEYELTNENNEKETLNIELIQTSELITNISHMFYECSSLINLPDIYEFDVSNVIDLSFIFHGCSSLMILSDISVWNTSNVRDMRNIFSQCESLTFIPDISKWETSNVTTMNSMFFKCLKLLSIPDISKWNISNVVDLSYLFYRCSSLVELPNISKWNTSNVNNISYMFYKCSSLVSLPDISKWNTSNLTDICYLFFECSSLISVPDISNWNTSKIKNMKGLFSYCSELKHLPNISKWEMRNVTNISEMFYKCKSLDSLPDISKWNLSKVTDKSLMFFDCKNNIIPK